MLLLAATIIINLIIINDSYYLSIERLLWIRHCANHLDIKLYLNFRSCFSGKDIDTESRA